MPTPGSPVPGLPSGWAYGPNGGMTYNGTTALVQNVGSGPNGQTQLNYGGVTGTVPNATPTSQSVTPWLQGTQPPTNTQKPTDPALSFWQRANPGQTPNLPPGYNPSGGSTQPSTPAAPIANSNQDTAPTQGQQPSTQTQSGTNPLIQALTQPIGADLMGRMLNQKNAQDLGGAATQNDQLRDQAAASGFGAYNPALARAQVNNTLNARNSVASNNLTVPLDAAQYNAQYGLGLGELAALSQSNLSDEQLKQLGLGTDTSNLLLRLVGGLAGGT